MNVKYIPNGNTKIVIEGKTYQNQGDKHAVLPSDKISKDELERLLKTKFIKKLELDESGAPASATEKEAKQKPDNKQTPEEKARKKLLKEAADAGVTATDEMTNEEIQKLIAEAKAKTAQV